MASPLGGLLARPWYDRAALFLLMRWFFPLSRLWAAARASEGDCARFWDEVPMAPLPALQDRLEGVLRRFEDARAKAAAADIRWEAVFFGSDDAAPDARVAAEQQRLAARHVYNAMRLKFAFVGATRTPPLVRWEIPTPTDVEAVHGAALADPEAAFAPPGTMPTVTASRRVAGPGRREYWLRFRTPSPRLGDHVVARVYEPDGVSDPPTLIFAHGICVEFDHWRGTIDEVAALCRMGIRVVRPETPWHGRRAAPGRYGGEPFIAGSPLAALDLFLAQAGEIAVLIDWCRRQGGAPVAIGGCSLGALMAQLVATRARDWPARLRPDALFVITHCGRFEAVATGGALSRAFGIPRAMAAHGWSAERMARWLPLLDPQGPPAMSAETIVTVLGRRDTVTPYAEGRALVERWKVPAENAFVSNLGHFSVPIGLLRDGAPLRRFAAVLKRLAG